MNGGSRSSPTRSAGSRDSTVAVERGAGTAAGFPDDAYAEAGAELVDDAWRGVDGRRQGREADRRGGGRSSARGQVLIAFLAPLTDREGDRAARAARRRSASRWSRSRASRARSRWTRSRRRRRSSGYKAALLAAERLPRFFPMLTTAAGTIAAREGARARRGRRRAAGDRDGAAARRGRVRLRRAAGRARAGAVASARRSSTSASSARRPRAATHAS